MLNNTEKAIAFIKDLQKAIESENVERIIEIYNLNEEDESFSWELVEDKYFEKWDELVSIANDLIY